MAVAVFLTLLRVRQARRKMMFAVSIATMLVTFFGFTLLEGFLADHPLLFAIYWFFCIGLVLFMLLLAIYDMAAVKGDLDVRAGRELAEVLKEIEEKARAEKGGDED